MSKAGCSVFFGVCLDPVENRLQAVFEDFTVLLAVEVFADHHNGGKIPCGLVLWNGFDRRWPVRVTHRLVHARAHDVVTQVAELAGARSRIAVSQLDQAI